MSLSLRTLSPHRFRPAAEPLLPCSYHCRLLVLLLMCIDASCNGNGHLVVGAEKPWWNTMDSLEGVEKYLDVARSHVGDKFPSAAAGDLDYYRRILTPKQQETKLLEDAVRASEKVGREMKYYPLPPPALPAVADSRAGVLKRQLEKAKHDDEQVHAEKSSARVSALRKKQRYKLQPNVG